MPGTNGARAAISNRRPPRLRLVAGGHVRSGSESVSASIVRLEGRGFPSPKQAVRGGRPVHKCPPRSSTLQRVGGSFGRVAVLRPDQGVEGLRFQRIKAAEHRIAPRARQLPNSLFHQRIRFVRNMEAQIAPKGRPRPRHHATGRVRLAARRVQPEAGSQREFFQLGPCGSTGQVAPPLADRRRPPRPRFPPDGRSPGTRRASPVRPARDTISRCSTAFRQPYGGTVFAILAGHAVADPRRQKGPEACCLHVKQGAYPCRTGFRPPLRPTWKAAPHGHRKKDSRQAPPPPLEETLRLTRHRRLSRSVRPPAPDRTSSIAPVRHKADAVSCPAPFPQICREQEASPACRRSHGIVSRRQARRGTSQTVRRLFCRHSSSIRRVASSSPCGGWGGSASAASS